MVQNPTGFSDKCGDSDRNRANWQRLCFQGIADIQQVNKMIVIWA